MASFPIQRSRLGGLTPVSEDSATPARGRETRQALLAKLRPPPLVHAWDFWYEKPSERTGGLGQTDAASSQYQPQLSLLHAITDVRSFWTVYNNFSFTSLPARHCAHLFHKSVFPQWEDPRNVRGGSWYFRVPRAQASRFWVEICMMAIGEKLQEAVYDEKKMTFRDDICGVSFCPRFSASLIAIWNRDGRNEVGIKNILQTVMENLPDELRPKESTYYYKRHDEHAGFNAGGAAPAVSRTNVAEKAAALGLAKELPGATAGEAADLQPESQGPREASVQALPVQQPRSIEAPFSPMNAHFDEHADKEEVEDTFERHAEVTAAVEDMKMEMEKLQKALEEVQVNDQLLRKKLELEMTETEGEPEFEEEAEVGVEGDPAELVAARNSSGAI